MFQWTPTKAQRHFVLLSPILVIALGNFVAHMFFRWIGPWAWVPLQFVYWFALCTITYRVGALPSLIEAYRRSSRWPWWLFGLSIGIIPLPILLFHLSLLRQTSLLLCWLAIALINPFIEEAYWRGLFGEVTSEWPLWSACLYPTLFFAFAHPLQWGVFSIASRHWQTFGSLIIMGTTWSLMYRKTRSLRAATFSHLLVDLGNMSVWIFLNIYVPPVH